MSHIDDSFDPAAHVTCARKSFDELRVGDRFVIPSRTIGDANFSAFQAASMDNHPIHYDMEYCRAQGHPTLLGHGYQALILCAPGASALPHVLGDALIGFVEQSSKFLGPLYLGDTAYPALEITDLTRQRTNGVVTLRNTVHNQRRELILDGWQKLLVRLLG
ncbi:MaoC family dehydratase [Pukyongiella litopenaei]|uniref:MaoC family dehydratase n=1 Tax=Pukyongiella litopenaei TaxID=2605946 RepID=A0A2S0MNM1_9RHOB|nr:MaoC family dehydratase [Pukyongiella litopenaei]AVO37468.1 MaoC family dehydratase [Pukyongiella litopenaei]